MHLLRHGRVQCRLDQSTRPAGGAAPGPLERQGGASVAGDPPVAEQAAVLSAIGGPPRHPVVGSGNLGDRRGRATKRSLGGRGSASAREFPRCREPGRTVCRCDPVSLGAPGTRGWPSGRGGRSLGRCSRHRGGRAGTVRRRDLDVARSSERLGRARHRAAWLPSAAPAFAGLGLSVPAALLMLLARSASAAFACSACRGRSSVRLRFRGGSCRLSRHRAFLPRSATRRFSGREFWCACATYRLRVRSAAHLVVGHSETLARGGDIRSARRLFADGERALQQRLGLGVLVLRFVEFGERIERLGNVGAVGALFLGQGQRLLGKRYRLGVLPRGLELRDLLVERRRFGSRRAPARRLLARRILSFTVALPRRPALLRARRRRASARKTARQSEKDQWMQSAGEKTRL